jgi:hypothetical protein
MPNDDEKNSSLYRADTIPPPDGESDAYNAPTKVGPISAAAVAEMMKGAELKVAEVNARAKQPPAPEPDMDTKATRRVAPANIPELDIASKGLPSLADGDEAAEGASSAHADSPASAEDRSLARAPEAQPEAPADAPSPDARTPAPTTRYDRLDWLLIGLIIVAAVVAVYILRR